MTKRAVKLTQPIVVHNGRSVFRPNAIVRTLLDESQARGFGLNQLSVRDFTQEDWEQFYQLIGYSITGYHELSRVSDESARLAPGGCRDSGCEIHCGVETEP